MKNVMRTRVSDRPVRRYSVILHYIGGFCLGWICKGYFPKRNAFMIAEDGWAFFKEEIVVILPILISAILGIFQIIKWWIERNDKRK